MIIVAYFMSFSPSNCRPNAIAKTIVSRIKNHFLSAQLVMVENKEVARLNDQLPLVVSVCVCVCVVCWCVCGLAHVETQRGICQSVCHSSTSPGVLWQQLGLCWTNVSVCHICLPPCIPSCSTEVKSRLICLNPSLLLSHTCTVNLLVDLKACKRSMHFFETTTSTLWLTLTAILRMSFWTG